MSIFKRLIFRTRKSIYTSIKYGALYNWYAATDVRNIAGTGWHLATRSEHLAIGTYLGGNSVAGGKMKETGNTYWITNVGATNESKYNGKGSGRREGTSGIFIDLQSKLSIMIDFLDSPTELWSMSLYKENATLAFPLLPKSAGQSIRLMKDTTTLLNGETGNYIGNDGKVYRTICIGTQEWLADNLNETKYRNGDWINGFNGGVYTPIDNSTWSSLTTEAMCYYNDDI